MFDYQSIYVKIEEEKNCVFEQISVSIKNYKFRSFKRCKDEKNIFNK